MTLLMNDIGHAGHGTSPRRLPVSAGIVGPLVVTIDMLVILTVGLTVYVLWVGSSAYDIGHYSAAIGFVLLAAVLIFNYAGLYEFAAIVRPRSAVDKLTISLVTVFTFLLSAAFAIKATGTISRVWLVSFGIGSWIGMIAARAAAAAIIRRMGRSRVFTRNVLIVGRSDYAAAIAPHLEQQGEQLISVVGTHAADGGTTPDAAELLAMARTLNVDDVVIAEPWSAEAKILAWVATLRELPVNVYLAPEPIGLKLDFKDPPRHFGRTRLVQIIGRPLSDWDVVAKCVEDYVLATIALVMLSPVMLAAAVAVRLDSPGPILFRQKRLGFNNREFNIYKFRTMRHGPEPTDRTIQATRRDSRVTRVGRILRRTSIDELPQLFNVLNGTMSLVGPRPHALDHNLEYGARIRGYFARHRMKPGLTGWAQVSGHRGETDTPEKMEARVRHDVYYIEHWSLLLDMRILLKTAFVVVGDRNAY